MAARDFEELLHKYDFVPNRALGQNFLISRRAVLSIADELELSDADTVLEIGAGTGQLTRELASRAKRVIAVELDRRLEPLLKSYLSDFIRRENDYSLINKPDYVKVGKTNQGDEDNAGNKSLDMTEHNHNVELIWSDVLKIDLQALLEAHGVDARDVKIAANLPYYATTDIMQKLLAELPMSKKMLLTVQREAVARITASPGSKQFGPLAVLTSLYGEIKTVMKLSPQDFWPQPDISSSLLALTSGSDSLLGGIQSGPDFVDFLINVFQQRRKQFMGRLRKEGKFVTFPVLEKVLSDFILKNSLKTDFRIEDLRPEQLLNLHQQIIAGRAYSFQ
ncbi:MAG TPA: rRNA adenine dimethyltransferase family protein [Bacillota bacterium]|nr:rRNA adenine dimethyltransferase family protein [Bacillota bacterium]